MADKIPGILTKVPEMNRVASRTTLSLPAIHIVNICTIKLPNGSIHVHVPHTPIRSVSQPRPSIVQALYFSLSLPPGGS